MNNNPFWSNDPLILFNKDYILEIFPTANMCYEQKLNAVTRLIIIITLLGYILTMSNRILISGFVTLAIIFIFYKIRKQKLTQKLLSEGFAVEGNEVTGLFDKSKSTSGITNITPKTLSNALNENFKEGTKKNPFSNVLLTQIMDDPERKSAPPAFNPDVEENITKNIKRSVQFMNPEIKNSNKQLFGDLWEQFELDQSNRVFYSTANTRVANDQTSFGKFLYGDMPSSKESGIDSAIQREKDAYRYTLY